jgi:hypothetical protein
VAADHGQFTIEIAYKGRFLIEPEGSSPDVAGRASARKFDFDSIGPHSGRTIKLEVLLAHLIDGVFFVDFEYGCPTCARDGTSQMLMCDARQSSAPCTTVPPGTKKAVVLGLPRSNR